MSGINDFLIWSLLAFSQIIGVSQTPSDTGIWTLTKPWEEHGGSIILEASTERGQQWCAENPSGFLRLPIVVHGGHQLLIDGTMVFSIGNTNPKKGEGYYIGPSVPCSAIPIGKVWTWKVYSHSKYFTRFARFPYFSMSRGYSELLASSAGFASGVALVLLGVFSALIFKGKIPTKTWISIFSANIFTAIYFLAGSSATLPMELSVLALHKIGLISLWIGLVCLFHGFYMEGLIQKKMIVGFGMVSAPSILGMYMTGSSDVVQWFVTLLFMPCMSIAIYAFFILFLKKDSNEKSKRLFQILSLGLFIVCSSNDVFFVVGLVDTLPIYSIGVTFAQYLFSLSVNEEISRTYVERDYLRMNLEEEVIKKTNQLESAMKELRGAQAELVHSAKLASLGTLSAGIAHEINNSINYVNGAIIPLEKLVKKSIPLESDRANFDKLFVVMKDGVRLTVEMVRSLRNFSGVNQAKFNDINLYDVIQSVIVILKNKLKNAIDIKIEVDKNLSVFGSVVGLNQVFMNLITNAIDAMPEGGTLLIAAKPAGEFIELAISDTGQGIPGEIIERIFDPFFTTKEVGKGTGLGLHIVKTEVARHGGTLNVTTKEGEGTRFTIMLPSTQLKQNTA